MNPIINSITQSLASTPRGHILGVLANNGGIYRELMIAIIVRHKKIPKSKQNDYVANLNKEIDNLISEGFIEEKKTSKGIKILVATDITMDAANQELTSPCP